MEIHYTRKAAEQLEKLPRDIQKRIAKKMRFYATQDDPLQFAERLTEPREGEFRFRVGDYRIIFDVVHKKIFVLAIKKRDKAYY
ncbi:MAG: type II toxin-antitoxin system RelE/ParE family toxin [Patescibacteria group bacterium]